MYFTAKLLNFSSVKYTYAQVYLYLLLCVSHTYLQHFQILYPQNSLFSNPLVA